MSDYIYLSHILSEDAPGYGGAQGFFNHSATKIKEGRSSNSSKWELSNHIGTHIDAPYHFSDEGTKLDDVDANFWIFNHIHLATYAANPAELIPASEWVNDIPKDCDLLLIQTGFEKFRNEDKYWEQNPGLSKELGLWLRENRPSIRALGIDVLSATSWQKREEGRIAHRAFLSPIENGASPIWIIEDMKLSSLTNSPKQVIVSPIRVKSSDGAPVTVLAKLV